MGLRVTLAQIHCSNDLSLGNENFEWKAAHKQELWGKLGFYWIKWGAGGFLGSIASGFFYLWELMEPFTNTESLGGSMCVTSVPQLSLELELSQSQ